MKESWHDSVLQIIHILCYYDTRLHFPILNYDKQHQAKTLGYLYKNINSLAKAIWQKN